MNRYRVDCQDHYDLEETQDGWLVVYDDVAEAIAAAVAAEREACAQIADDMLGDSGDLIAQTIRMRSNA